MGGSRFNQETPRMTTDVYEKRLAIIQIRLQSMGIEAGFPATLKDKESHGDIDLITTQEMLFAKGMNGFAKALCAIDQMQSSSADMCPSFLLRDQAGFFQVDVRAIKGQNLGFAERYQSAGDAGALTSFVASNLGLSMSLYGLFVRTGGRADQLKVPLDVTYNQALSLIGLDCNLHEKGFACEEDIFAWIINGRYFNPAIFMLENMSNKSRAKSKRSEMQNKFRNLIKDLEPADPTLPAREDTKYWQSHWQSIFPYLQERENTLREQKHDARNKSQIMSSSVVSDMTGYTGKALTKFMSRLANDEIIQSAVESKDSLAFQERTKIILSDLNT